MEKRISYKTQGTCSTKIDIVTEDNIIKDVVFTNGCNGNTQGVARLVKGMTVDEAISRLRGIQCGFRSTSCPDQLAIVLTKLKDQQ